MSPGQLLSGPNERCVYALGSLESTTVRFSPLRRDWRRSNRLICYINVTGFASVMLVLFYFLLLLQPLQVCVGNSVVLPQMHHAVSMPASNREDAMVIAVMRDGRVFFGTDCIEPWNLPVKIRDRVSRSAERKVYIRADARAKYGAVKDVLDGVRSSGIEKIGFLVEQRRSVAGVQ
jgi:biopolymer transport protein TolR